MDARSAFQEDDAASLRPACPADEPFLFQLFAESQEQLAGLRSNEALWRSLVEMQYRGRKMTYAAQYPAAEDSILLDEDGRPVGRLLLDRRPDRWRIVHIAVLASRRGRGLGTRVVRQCRQRSAAAGARLELQVRPENPARRLYERLGFRVAHENLLTVEMVLDIVNAANHMRMEPSVAVL
jgi:ribosomal protein S18 acetylase RimI-like enzyme